MRFLIGFRNHEMELSFYWQRWDRWTYRDIWSGRVTKGFDGLLGFINFSYTKPGENIGDSISRVLRQWPEKPKKDESAEK